MSVRGAVLAVCLLIGIAAGVTVLRTGGAGVEVGSVELGAADAKAAGTPEQKSSEDAEEEGDGGVPATGGVPASGGDGPAGAGQTKAAGPTTVPSILVIHVAGAVGSPGVVRVPSGSRAGDAVEAAGGAGAEADLAAVNLAAPLEDGMMVVVPRIGENAGNPPPVAGTVGPAGAAGNGQGAGGAGSGGTNGTGAGAGDRKSVV